jgi:uncharacterized membrane protein
MKRYLWSVVLAVVGGILSTKTVVIKPVSILEGCLIGAIFGFILGLFLDRRNASAGSDRHS